jgi:hypothetical protein
LNGALCEAIQHRLERDHLGVFVGVHEKQRGELRLQFVDLILKVFTQFWAVCDLRRWIIISWRSGNCCEFGTACSASEYCNEY